MSGSAVLVDTDSDVALRVDCKCGDHVMHEGSDVAEFLAAHIEDSLA